jgi:hypothetical protein
VTHVHRPQLGALGSQHAGDDEHDQTDDGHHDDGRRVLRQHGGELEQRERRDDADADEAQRRTGVSDETEKAVALQFQTDPFRKPVIPLDVDPGGGKIAGAEGQGRGHCSPLVGCGQVQASLGEVAWDTIVYIDLNVNISYTSTDEKIPSYYVIP